MDNSKIVFLINDQARAIHAKYDPDVDVIETFKTLDPTIAVDDIVVVESGTRHNMTVVKVLAVDVDVDFDAQSPVKWVVARIDQVEFDETVEREAKAVAAVNAVELRRKKAKLREKMFDDNEDEIKALMLDVT